MVDEGGDVDVNVDQNWTKNVLPLILARRGKEVHAQNPAFSSIKRSYKGQGLFQSKQTQIFLI